MTDPARRVLAEPAVFLAEVARRHRVHPETALRWVREGLAVQGRRVRLEAIKIGRWRTSEAALARFAAAIAAARVAGGGAVAPRQVPRHSTWANTVVVWPPGSYSHMFLS